MFKESIEQNSDPENQEQPKSEKEILWEKKAQEIEEMADKLGSGIDENIKETVLALNALGILTTQSCEGHSDFETGHGVGAPWIRVEASGEPNQQYIDQEEIFQEVASKHNLPVKTVKQANNLSAYAEAIARCRKRGETREYKKWEEKCKKLQDRITRFLDEFYKKREVSDNVKLVMDGDLHNGGEDCRPLISMREEEKQGLPERLVKYQEEMRAFTEFLKEKFFSEDFKIEARDDIENKA